MNLLETLLYCGVVSLIWGATNPFIKKSTSEINKVQSSNFLSKFIHELSYLIKNWRCVLFFTLNQCGSVLYFLILQSAELSLAVPITNALTFVVTGVVGILLGEEKPDSRVLAGGFFVFTGITLCILDKAH